MSKEPAFGMQRDDGKIWNRFEWVTPERFNEQFPPPTGHENFLLEDEAAPYQVDTSTFASPLGVTALIASDTARFQEALIKHLLTDVIGETSREGLLETPRRVLKAWKEWTSGYGKDPASVLKAFKDGAEGCNEMVVVSDIPFYSKCEHHLADIFGTATIAYIPDGKIVGLSKLPRLLEVYARRLQVQERLTNQVAEALMTHLEPRGCGVIVRARHMCMESRGINKPGTSTTTCALRGVFSEPAVRAEFLTLHGGK